MGDGEKSLEEGIAAERRAVVANVGTPDSKEGMRAINAVRCLPDT